MQHHIKNKKLSQSELGINYKGVYCCFVTAVVVVVLVVIAATATA